MTISINSRKPVLQIPKTDRSKLSCRGKYRMIVQHEVTKRVHVFKLSDVTVCGIRFIFKIKFPEDFQEGTYTYYLVSNDHWTPGDINRNSVRQSVLTPEVSGITTGENFIITGDTLLITDYYLAKIEDLYEATGILFVSEEKYDNSPCDVEGRLYYKKLDIIHTGILKYRFNEPTDFSNTFKTNPQEEFVTFKSIR